MNCIRQRTGAYRPSIRGIAQIEVVMTTAISVPMAVFLFFMCIKACAFFYRLVADLVGGPFL